MKTAPGILLASLGLALAWGCGNPGRGADRTEPAPADAAPAKEAEDPEEEREEPVAKKDLARVVLLDVQGLFGGLDLWIGPGGRAVARFVEPPREGETGLQETRYPFALTEEQKADLAGLLEKHRFASIRTEQRYGVPDEARPCIFVESGGESHAVAKWANDRHPDFDPVYGLLKRIAESARSGEPAHHGTHDWNWKPEGFPENQTLREQTIPKPK